MFRQLNNIETAFRHVRFLSIVVLVCAFTLCGYCVYYCIEKVSRNNDRVYLISGGKAFEAVISTRKDNVPIEARDHIKTFHELFFNLSPDEEAIESTITKSLYLADRSAQRAYDDLRERGFYSSLISGNVSQHVSCDSVSVDVNRYPIYFKYYGRQFITRTSAIITRKLVTEGYLRTVDRTDNNSHGFLIERWLTLDNSDISVQKR